MRYQIKGLKGAGVTVLTLDARDAHEAEHQAAVQGVTAFSVKAANALDFGLRPRRTRFSLLLFSQELLALLDAGVNLVEALETLAEKQNRDDARAVLEQIIARLREGQPLSAAFQQFPDIFPALYVATLRASEKTGDMSQALARYVAYQVQLDAVRKKLISATIYPAVLICVGVLVTFFLLGYVVPRFSEVYEDLGDNLPWMSRMMLAWGKLLAAHSVMIAIAAVSIVALAVHGLRQPATWQKVFVLLQRIPMLGERMQIYQLARFYRTLGMLLRGGLAVVPALHMVAGLLNTALRPQLDAAIRLINEGHAISEAMETNGLTTPVATRLLRVGERSGQMGEMMERIAQFYDEELARWVEWFTKLFEPLLMAAIGIFIGVIVLLMYMPIFELASSVQ